MCLASVSPSEFDCTPHHFSSIFTAPDTVGAYNIKVISQEKIMKGSAGSIHTNALTSSIQKLIDLAEFLKTLPPNNRPILSSSF